MAKTTTKSQAKTKTTKKTAAAKRASTKTTTKTVKKDVKVAAKSVAAKTTKIAKTVDYIGQTQRLQRLGVVAFIALAAGAVYAMTNDARSISLGYMVKDEVGSAISNTTVFAPAMRTILEVPVKWILVTILGISTLFQLLNLTVWKRRYEQGAQTGLNPLRWVEIGVSGALMVELAALLSGVTDILVLKSLAAFVVILALMGWQSDRQNLGAAKPVKLPFITEMIAGAVPLVFVGVTALATWMYGMIRSPWYVYALYAVLLFALIGLKMTQWYRYTQRKKWTDSKFVERNYTLIGVVTKIVFAGILIFGFRK